MSLSVGPTGQVASFEPDPVAFSRLEFHVRANRLTNVVLFRAAVSSGTGKGTMIAAQGLGSTFSHLRYPDEPEPEERDTVQVETVEPDELVSSGRLRRPDLIKVDVQGHGNLALQGSVESIRATRPVIIFSSHSPWELSGTRELLEPLGYTVESLQGHSMLWEELATETGILVACGGAPTR